MAIAGGGEYLSSTNHCKAFTLAEGATHVAMLDNTRKSAFTLAEVLITLGIIGVVAALTLPSLVANYKEKVMISQAKKGLSVVLNTLSKTRARLEVENNGEIFDSNNTPDQTADLFFANMNVASRCNSAGYCNFF